jgi:hypothetical protein
MDVNLILLLIRRKYFVAAVSCYRHPAWAYFISRIKRMWILRFSLQWVWGYIFGTWCPLTWWKIPIFRKKLLLPPSEGGSVFLRAVGIFLLGNTQTCSLRVYVLKN